jgi:lipooligosaccharide transport system permease protein
LSIPAPLRVVEANARSYRRVWKGSFVSTFLSPVLFLAAMGLGLGSLVDRNTSVQSLQGLSYIAFLAPGLLAATAMQTGAGESSWPVMAGIKWIKTFHATLATPIGVDDLVLGFLIWIALRLLMVCIAFVVVMALFGAVPFVDGLLAVPAAVLTGLAFAAPIVAFTAYSERETRLSSLFRFAIIPMFLFSGTFFPVSQLPGWLQPVAYVTPLWHGVELARAAALGTPESVAPALHVFYLLGWLIAGTFLAERGLRRRLQP